MPIQGSAAGSATTTAYAASLIIKAGPGTLYGLVGYNAKTSAQFIQLHDALTLPADTAVPKTIFSVAASTPFSLSFEEIGRYFSVGIIVCNSSTGPTKTIGSADCWFDAQYISMAKLAFGSQLATGYFGGTASSGAAAPIPPTNTVAPAVTGTAVIGQTLTTTDGTWTGDATITFTYQWQRDTVNIGSATASTYLLAAADSSKSVRCVVTGTNAAGAVAANSNAVSVAAGTGPSGGTAILDDGSRTENPLTNGGKWTGPLISGNTNLQSTPTQIFRVGAPAGSMYWNALPGLTSCEVYATVANTTIDNFIFLRMANPGGASLTGYSLEAQNGSMFVHRWDNNAKTKLGATITQAMSAGDSMGLSATSSTITVWVKAGAGAWTSVTTRTDATYASGVIGLQTPGTSGSGLSFFGGGVV